MSKDKGLSCFVAGFKKFEINLRKINLQRIDTQNYRA